MHFRETTPADLPELFRIRVAAKENVVTREWLTAQGITEASCTELLRSTHRGWVCEVDGRVVGFAQGNRANGELWVIAVLPEYEGRGIGRRLMTLVQDWLWSEGWDMLWLTTDSAPTRAHHLYASLGWRDVGDPVDGIQRMELSKSL